jgi:protein-L-isoaspartate(D-aspartate) O-methyltransferase
VSKQPAGDDSVGRMQFMLTLRRRGIGDAAVLRAMDEVPREYFVEGGFLDAAYADRALPIACGQTISQPYVVAYMSEQLGVRGDHQVLEIGTGSGYQAAILSRLARELITIERFRTLADAARVRLETLGYRNVEVRLGDGLAGAPDRAPFDRIIVTAACETRAQTVSGGRSCSRCGSCRCCRAKLVNCKEFFQNSLGLIRSNRLKPYLLPAC